MIFPVVMYGGESWTIKKAVKWSEVAQLCLTLCDRMDCSLPGSSVHGISWQEYWSGLTFPTPEDLPNPGIEPGCPTFQADALPSDPREGWGRTKELILLNCGAGEDTWESLGLQDQTSQS